MTTTIERNFNMNTQGSKSSAAVNAPGTTPDPRGDQGAAVAAITFSLQTTEGLEFLRAWQHGDWDVIRREWPEAPATVFVAQSSGPVLKPAQDLARERLFEKRVPEAAARQCATVLAWLTECNLATLEDLKGLKSTSAARLHRQQSICDTAVAQCVDLGVEAVGLRGNPCSRLAEFIYPKRAQK